MKPLKKKVNIPAYRKEVYGGALMMNLPVLYWMKR